MSDTTETTTPAAVEPLRPRVGTIVWGALLLLVAAITIGASQLDLGEATPEAIVWGVVAVGGLLVLGGIATAIVRAARAGSQP
jgi:hypothetical protein